jgi:hypothetical protein
LYASAINVIFGEKVVTQVMVTQVMVTQVMVTQVMVTFQATAT